MISPCRLSELCLVTEGALRIAPLLGLPRFLEEHGLDPDTEIRVNGCDPALFQNPENTIDFGAVGRLLGHTATVTSCPHPGLELGRHSSLDALGMLGQAVRLAADVGTALRALILDFHVHDRGAVLSLWHNEHQAMLGYTVCSPDVPGTDHIYDGALAIANNFVAELARRDWKATEVRLYREKPKNIEPYRRHFRAPLRFSAAHAAIVFPATDLARPLANANPDAYARALRDLEDMDAVCGIDLASKTRHVLRRLFVSGSGADGVDVQTVAQLFALHPRTLHRRLHAEGTTFSALLEESRYEIARQLLRDTQMQATEIACALGYADSTAFTRAFRRWSGTTTTGWRASRRAS